MLTEKYHEITDELLLIKGYRSIAYIRETTPNIIENNFEPRLIVTKIDGTQIKIDGEEKINKFIDELYKA